MKSRHGQASRSPIQADAGRVRDEARCHRQFQAHRNCIDKCSRKSENRRVAPKKQRLTLSRPCASVRAIHGLIRPECAKSGRPSVAWYNQAQRSAGAGD